MRLTREEQRKKREDAVKAAIDRLDGRWPSVALIADLAGVSPSTVDRVDHLLLDARLAWENVNGPHPQWRRPGSEAESPTIERPGAGAGDQVARLREQLADALTHVDREREDRKKAEAETDRLREENRRLLLGLRPARLSRLLDGCATG